MGYWIKREEEEKGQGEKEKMTFPGLRTNHQLKHAGRSGQTPGSEFIIAANFNYLYKRGRSERRCRVSCMRLAYMEPRLNEGFEGKCMADCAGKCSKQ